MENSVQTHNRIFLLVLLTIVVSAASVFVPLFYLVLPALYAVVLIRSNNPVLAVPLFCPALLAGILLTGSMSPASEHIRMFSMIFGGILSGIAIWQVEKRNKGCFFTAMYAAGCFTLSLYCAVCLPGILSGEGAFTEIQNSFAETAEMFKETAQMLPAGVTPEFLGSFSQTVDSVVAAVPVFVVPSIIVISCILGLCNTLFFRLFVKKHREALGISPMLPFRKWSVPKSLTPGIIILLIGSIILNLTGSTVYEGVSASVSALIGFPFLIQAVALVDYLIERSKSAHTVKRVLIYIACGVFINFLLSPLIMLGCFEQLFRLRERMETRRQNNGSAGNGGMHS